MQLLKNVAKKVFGTQNDRELKSIYPLVGRVNELQVRDLVADIAPGRCGSG